MFNRKPKGYQAFLVLVDVIPCKKNDQEKKTNNLYNFLVGRVQLQTETIFYVFGGQSEPWLLWPENGRIMGYFGSVQEFTTRVGRGRIYLTKEGKRYVRKIISYNLLYIYYYVNVSPIDWTNNIFL